MEDNALYDLIIIGGGPAGLAAGLYAMRATLRTVLIEKGVFGGQVATTKDVENYLGIEEISGFELSEKFYNHAKSYGLPTIRAEVRALKPGKRHHSITLDDNTTLHAHAIIIAAGSSPRKLNIPGEQEYQGKGVSYCAKCDGLFFKDQTVVVAGGGDTATEEAIYLAKLAKRVHMVHLEDNLRAGKILRNRLMNECNVEIHPNATISEIKGKNGGVSSAVIKEMLTGKSWELPTDGVFVFIGLAPNNTLVPFGIRKTPGGHIITDEKGGTTIPGIFVAGDLRHKYAKQISVAVADGCVSALAAAQYIEMKKEEKLFCDLYVTAA